MNASPDGPKSPSVAEGGYARPGDAAYDLHAPAPWIAFLRKYIWVIGTILLLGIITGTRPFLARRPPPPEVIGQLPEVVLLDQEGQPFGNDEMRGHVWVVGFVFTRCPSTCPAVSAAMAQFHEQIRRAQLDDHVHLLTVTVDPEHDRPEVLRAYGESLGADFETWRFVTGEPADIEHFVVDGFKVAVGERTEGRAWGLRHRAFDEAGPRRPRRGSSRGLFDRRGRPHRTLPPHARHHARDPEGAGQVRSQVAQKLPGVLVLLATSCEPPAPAFTSEMTLQGEVVAADVLNAGHGLYRNYCRSCHGDDGRGAGPAAGGLPNPPRDFAALTATHDEVLRMVQEGRPERGMPSWKGFRHEDLDALARYVETFAVEVEQ